MPQPIPRGKDISLDFRGSAVLERPHLSPYIASILVHWNEMESRLGIFLAALLASEASTVIKVFLALQTDGGRKTTIDTVTKLKLSPDELGRFQEIQKDIGSRYSERNKAVHGAWGISPDYPNDLLWYDPRESIAMFPALVAKEKLEDRVAVMKEVNEKIRIYVEKDFKDILERFKGTYSALENFTSPYLTPLFAEMNKRP